MPELSRITLPSGTTYDLKDATARAAIAGGTSFLGITTTALTDGSTISTITIGGESVSAVNGGIAIYNSKEFIYADTDSSWHEIGDTGNLGDLAYKDTASASYTPAGGVSKPTFTGTEGNLSVTGTPTGSITTGTGTANYTPAGSVSTPTITVTPSTVSKYVAASATGGGSATAGTAAACTLPVLTTSVANETLTIGWTAGSFTANVPTKVTMPSFSSQTIATGISSATSTQPTFTGTGTQLKFAGDSMTSTGKFTPAGDVSKPTFTGTAATIEVS